MLKFRSLLLKFHIRQNGQSMAEFCVFGPLLVLLLWSILYVSNLFIVKHDTLVAARYGTWLLARYSNFPPNHEMNQDDVEQLIHRNFFKGFQGDTKVEPYDIAATKDSEDFPDNVINSSEAGEWVAALEAILTDLVESGTPAIYGLEISHTYPRIFGAVDLSEYVNDDFVIKSDHYVIGNSWDGARVESHDLVDIIEQAIGEILDLIDEGQLNLDGMEENVQDSFDKIKDEVG